MELSASWEAAIRSATQKFPQHLMELEGLLPCSRESCTSPYPDKNESNPYNPILFL
jgi:hypothetical protein